MSKESSAVSIIERTGLSKQEAQVYLALLELGESTVLPISKKSGIHRTYCYDILESLRSRGLVSFVVKNNRRRFIPSDPSVIRNQIRESERTFDVILPDLLNLYAKQSDKPNMRFFEGHKGIEVVYREVSREAKEIWFMGSAEAWMKEFSDFVDYTKEQVRKNMRIRDLVVYGEDVKVYAKHYKRPLQQLRFLPKGIRFATDNIIWDNKIAMVSFRDQPHAVVIESEDIVNTFREMFEVLWKSGR